MSIFPSALKLREISTIIRRPCSLRHQLNFITLGKQPPRQPKRDMPDVSQSTTDPKLASQEPQNAPSVQSQQNQGEGGSSKEQIEALFRAARERNAKLTPEEIQEQYPWSAHPPKSVNSDVATAVLEELEAPAEDSDDAGDGAATGAGAEEDSTKTKA